MNLPLEVPLLIIVQNVASRQMIIAEPQTLLVNDLPEGNGYGISFRQDIPVQNQTISAC